MNTFEKDINARQGIYTTLLILIVLLSGLDNASGYISALGISFLPNIFLKTLYLVIAISLIIVIINFIHNNGYFSWKSKYWIPLVMVVAFKYLLLFVIDPGIFSPNRGLGAEFNYLGDLTLIIKNLSVLVLVTTMINNINRLKLAVWSLGITCAITVLIPFIFFPEMIGSRNNVLVGIDFYGFFWNPVVVSYLTIFWLYLAFIPSIKSKRNKIMVIIINCLIVLGGLAGLSRAFLLSIIISTAAFLIHSRRLKVTFIIIALVVFFIIIVYTFFPIVVNNYDARLNGVKSLEEELRILIWTDYLKSIKEYFLFGAWLEGPRHYNALRFGPHSIILNWWTRFGVFGVIAFLWLIYGLIVTVKYVGQNISKNQASAIFAWPISYFSVALINETGFRQTSIYVALGIIIAFGNLARKIRKQNEII